MAIGDTYFIPGNVVHSYHPEGNSLELLYICENDEGLSMRLRIRAYCASISSVL